MSDLLKFIVVENGEGHSKTIKVFNDPLLALEHKEHLDKSEPLTMLWRVVEVERQSFEPT